MNELLSSILVSPIAWFESEQTDNEDTFINYAIFRLIDTTYMARSVVDWTIAKADHAVEPLPKHYCAVQVVE